MFGRLKKTAKKLMGGKKPVKRAAPKAKKEAKKASAAPKARQAPEALHTPEYKRPSLPSHGHAKVLTAEGWRRIMSKK